MRAHRTDLVSLAFGLLFVGLAAWWLIARLLGFVLPPVGWFLAGALLLIGVLGLVGALRAARTAGPAAPDAGAVPAGAPVAAGGPAGTGSPVAFPPAAHGSPVAAPASGPPVPEVALGEFDRTGDEDRRPGHPEWDVSAPVSGAPGAGGAGREEADEWPTEATTDRPDEAVEERPADVPGDVPPSPPAGGDRR